MAAEDQSEEVRKMFVGGITADTTEAELKEHFGPFGEIEAVTILKKENADPAKKRFFGFITFTDMDSLDKVFLNRPHRMKVSEKEILLEVKHAVPKGNTHPGATLKTKKLFIANLSPTTTKEDITNYLDSRHPNKEYGTIEEINLIMKKQDGKDTGECKGFGFIQVSTEDFADKVAIHDNKFDLNGRTIELKKSEPRGGRGGYGGGRGGGRGGQQGYGGYGGYGGGGYADPYGYYAGGYGYGGWGQQGGGRGGRGRYQPY